MPIMAIICSFLFWSMVAVLNRVRPHRVRKMRVQRQRRLKNMHRKALMKQHQKTLHHLKQLRNKRGDVSKVRKTAVAAKVSRRLSTTPRPRPRPPPPPPRPVSQRTDADDTKRSQPKGELGASKTERGAGPARSDGDAARAEGGPREEQRAEAGPVPATRGSKSR